MSLIVARQEDQHINIVGDTKLTVPAELKERIGQNSHPLDGVVKSMIVNETVISFAGVVEFADLVIRQIQPKDELDTIIHLLHKCHIDSNQETEFIVATIEPQPLLYEIKSGHCEIVTASWIGSLRAFEKFQCVMLSSVNEVNRPSGITIQLSQSVSSTGTLGKMNKALDAVIESEEIEEVGGFRITITSNEGKFNYQGYLQSYWSKTITWKIPEGATFHRQALTHASASDGGYTINFFKPNSNLEQLGVHLKQGNFGIVYSREDRGLLRPTIINMDEVDFYDYVKQTFDLSPIGTTQDAEHKYNHEGTKALQDSQWQLAYNLFDKGLNIAKGLSKGRFLLGKAHALFNLYRVQEAIGCLSEAIQVNSALQSVAMQIVEKYKKFR